MPHSYISGIVTVHLYLHCFHVAAFDVGVSLFQAHFGRTNPEAFRVDTEAIISRMATNLRDRNLTTSASDFWLSNASGQARNARTHKKQYIDTAMAQLSASKDMVSARNIFTMIILVVIALCLCLWISPKARDCLQISMDSDKQACVGKPPPDFVMTLLDRSDKKIAELASLGKPMVVRFYTSREVEKYSSYSRDVKQECEASVKALSEMAEDVKYYQKVLFLLVAIDHPGTTDLQKYHDRMRISDKSINAELKRGWDKTLENGYCVDNLPHTTIVDANGIVVKNFDVFGAYLVDVRQCVDDILQGKLKVVASQQAKERSPKQKGTQRTGRRTGSMI